MERQNKNSPYEALRWDEKVLSRYGSAYTLVYIYRITKLRSFLCSMMEGGLFLDIGKFLESTCVDLHSPHKVQVVEVL